MSGIQNPQTGGGGTNPEDVFLTNGDAVSLVIGTPVVLTGAPATVQRAEADSLSLAAVIGIVIVGASPTNPAKVRLAGPVTATTAQWDAVTGQVGGLTPGVDYFLGVAPGTLSTAAPPSTSVGDLVVRVGRAIDSTRLNLDVTRPILL